MPTPAEEIKARLDIVEFIQSYVRLQKAGVNYKANCPFHGEKTPSFFVSPARASWHCFGCGKGGDVFQFLMEMEGHSFPEALNILAERTGVVIRREHPQARSERGRLGALCESSAQFFITELGRASEAQKYLTERGLKSETIKNFRIGFAPQSWDALSRTLMAKGFTQEEIGQAGLAIKSPERGSWYDRFRSRIMFPIADPSGKIIGFGGRIFISSGAPAGAQKDTEAKYINSPQTPLYDKSSVLYGFDRARQEMRKKNIAVIVEGYMDCVMSHQAGVTHTVAVSGTALTVQQLKIMRRLAETLVCSFDADGAGESATKRSLALAAQFDFDRRVAHIPSGKDPADTVREDPAAWVRAVETAKPVVEFYTERAFARENPATAAGKKAITSLLLPFIRELTDEVERAHWIGELSRRLIVPEEAIRKELERRAPVEMKRPMEQASAANEPVRPVSGRRALLEERYLALLSRMDPAVRIAEANAGETISFFSSGHKEIFRLLTDADASPREGSEGSPSDALAILQFKGDAIAEMAKDKDLAVELALCRRELEKEGAKERLGALAGRIHEQEGKGNREDVAALLGEFKNTSELLRALSA